jgi:hypothetical protein
MKKTISTADATDPRLPLVHALMADLQQALGKTPILAGGAPRDLLIGNEVRDFDLFIPAFGDAADLAEMVMLVTMALDNFERRTQRPLWLAAKSDEAYLRDDVRFVLGATHRADDKPDGEELPFVDVIFTNGSSWSPGEVIEAFDSPLCEAWATWTVEGFELCSSDPFDKCLERRVLPFWFDRMRGQHAWRLGEKFPGFMVLWLAPEGHKKRVDPSRMRNTSDRWPDDVPF